MANSSQYRIFFVDDEPGICKEMGEFLGNAGYEVICFLSPNECLEHMDSNSCDLLIADYKLPGLNGLELMRKAQTILPWLPVLIITGFGDIRLAVSAIKGGAVDFLEKPLDTDYFLQKIRIILQKNLEMIKLVNRSLTPMEKKVLRFVLLGKNNNEAAQLLNRSRRTVETHRANLMKKFGVNNVVDLCRHSSLRHVIITPDD